MRRRSHDGDAMSSELFYSVAGILLGIVFVAALAIIAVVGTLFITRSLFQRTQMHSQNCAIAAAVAVVGVILAIEVLPFLFTKISSFTGLLVLFKIGYFAKALFDLIWSLIAIPFTALLGTSNQVSMLIGKFVVALVGIGFLSLACTAKSRIGSGESI
jgi:hypothetical protein